MVNGKIKKLNTNHQRKAIRTTMRYCLSFVRMAIIQKTRKSKCRGGFEERDTLMLSWYNPMESSMAVPKKNYEYNYLMI